MLVLSIRAIAALVVLGLHPRAASQELILTNSSTRSG